jgi:selenium metabolism protein YedF
VGDEIAQANVTRLATKEGYDVSSETADDHIRLTLTLQEGLECQIPAADAQSPAANTTSTKKSPHIVYISSTCMGSGSDELGEVLMRNFIFTLGEVTPLPHKILFVNSGVRLTCSGSQVLEALQKLEQQGVQIFSCGLCLEFFDLKEQLKVGAISNMLETIEAMTEADKIIQP